MREIKLSAAEKLALDLVARTIIALPIQQRVMAPNGEWQSVPSLPLAGERRP